MKDLLIAYLVTAFLIMTVLFVAMVRIDVKRSKTIASYKAIILEMSRMMPEETDRKWSTKKQILNSVEKQ